MFTNSKYKNICVAKVLIFPSVHKIGQRPPYVDTLKNRVDQSAVCKLWIHVHLMMIRRGGH